MNQKEFTWKQAMKKVGVGSGTLAGFLRQLNIIPINGVCAKKKKFSEYDIEKVVVFKEKLDERIKLREKEKEKAAKAGHTYFQN